MVRVLNVKSAAIRPLLSAAAAAAGLVALAGPAGAATILTTFGGTTNLDAVGRKWNDVVVTRNTPAGSPGTATGTPITLLNTAATDSGVRLTVGNSAATTSKVGFNDINFGGGTSAPTGMAAALNYPGTSTINSGFGNGGAAFNAVNVQDVLLTLSNLDPTQKYSFNLFADRVAGDSRQTQYDIAGGPGGTAATTLTLEAANNTGTVVGASGFVPTAAGTITVDVHAGPTNSNNSGSNLYYLAVLQVDSSPVPEPTGFAAVAAGGAALLRRRRRA